MAKKAATKVAKKAVTKQSAAARALAKKYSDAGYKAWETRRKNEAAAKRAAAAKKAAATRKKNAK